MEQLAQRLGQKQGGIDDLAARVSKLREEDQQHLDHGGIEELAQRLA